MADRSYTEADLDAAIAAIGEPGRLQEAQDLVTSAAPSLQRVLNEALHEGGWFGEAHRQAVREASGGEDPAERARAVQTLIAEETLMGMFVGVAVGFELARELGRASSEPGTPRPTAPEGPPRTPGPPGPGLAGTPGPPGPEQTTQED